MTTSTEESSHSFPSLEILIRNSTSYAGIGSRNTPLAAQGVLSQLATLLAQRGLLLRSGGSPGADTAFEKGADRAHGKKEIFLPWQGFNGHPSPFFTPSLQAEVAASFCHPNWKACSEPARLLHAHNCQQIYGETSISRSISSFSGPPSRTSRQRGHRHGHYPRPNDENPHLQPLRRKHAGAMASDHHFHAETAPTLALLEP